jgi:hypothetical protein
MCVILRGGLDLVNPKLDESPRQKGDYFQSPFCKLGDIIVAVGGKNRVDDWLWRWLWKFWELTSAAQGSKAHR